MVNEIKKVILIQDRDVLDNKFNFVSNLWYKYVDKHTKIYFLESLVTYTKEETTFYYLDVEPKFTQGSVEYTNINKLEAGVIKPGEYEELYLFSTVHILTKPKDTMFNKIVQLEYGVNNTFFDHIHQAYIKCPEAFKDNLCSTPDKSLYFNKYVYREEPNLITHLPLLYYIATNYYNKVDDYLTRVFFLEDEQNRRTVYRLLDNFIYTLTNNKSSTKETHNVITSYINKLESKDLRPMDVINITYVLCTNYLINKFDKPTVNRLWDVEYRHNFHSLPSLLNRFIHVLYLLNYSRYNNNSDLLGLMLNGVHAETARLILSWDRSFLKNFDSVMVNEIQETISFKSTLPKDKQSIRLNYLHDLIYKHIYGKKSKTVKVVNISISFE